MGIKIVRPPGRKDWYLRISHNGERVTRHVGSRDAAFAAKREIETEIARGTFRLRSKAQTLTFEALAERWMERHVKANLRPRSVRNYEQALKHIIRRVGKVPAEDITRPGVRDFIEGLVVEARLARRTIQNIAAVMSSCLGYGVEMEVLQTNVAVRLKKLAKSEGPGRGVRALPLEEIRALLAAAREHTPPSFHAFLMCAATTGMRAGEMRALRWSDVDLNDGCIVVSKSAADSVRDPDGPTKGGKSRTVYMPEELRKVMVEHRRRLPEDRRREDEQVQLPAMAGEGRREGRDREDASSQPPAYGNLPPAQQRSRSVRGPEAGGAFGRPADHADLCARAGGSAQKGRGGT
jgi:integrase